MNGRAITKATELAILDEAIVRLGAQSYLGPWLASVRAEVAAEITSDLPPSPLPSESLRQATDILRAATEMATERGLRLETNAKIRAEHILADADARRAQVRRAVADALAALDGWS